MAYETARYQVTEKFGEFEIRKYDTMILAVSDETNLKGYYGFNQIFNYISGLNETKEKISMTTPVINDLSSTRLTTAFVMPHKFSLNQLPKPKADDVRFKTIEPNRWAVLRFSGNVNPQRVVKQKERLLLWIEQCKFTTTGEVLLARYNPPFIPGFLKRNEVLIRILD